MYLFRHKFEKKLEIWLLSVFRKKLFFSKLLCFLPTLEASASNEMLQILEVGLGHNVIGDLELKRSKQRIKRI